MNNSEKKKRLGTLDYVIIFAIIAVIACIAIRYIRTNSSENIEGLTLDDYVVTFSVQGIKDSSAKNYMLPGEKFYLNDSATDYITLLEGITITDAKTYYDLQNGEIVAVENGAVGDLYRVDVEAKATAKGLIDSNGDFLFEGTQRLKVNNSVGLKSKFLFINAKIVDISKVQ